MANMIIKSDASTTGWGAHQRKSKQGEVIWKEGSEPHQSHRTTSSFPNDPALCKAEMQHQYSSENRQCHSSDIAKQNGGNLFTRPLPAYSLHVGVVPAKGHSSDGRTSVREGEFGGRQGIKNDEGLS